MFKFSPGCCCKTDRCIYNGAWTQEAVDRLFTTDMRGSNNPIPWYVADGKGYVTPVYEPPDGVCDVIFQKKINAAGLAFTPNEFDSEFGTFAGGAMYKWGSVNVTTGQIFNPEYASPFHLGPDVEHIKWHSLYVAILMYTSRINGPVNLTMSLIPVDHLTGTISKFYNYVWFGDCKYFSAALTHWDHRSQLLRIPDCGLYTCACIDSSGANREIIPVVPYPTAKDDVDWEAIAQSRGETYPSGNYYFVSGNAASGPGYTYEDTHPERIPYGALIYAKGDRMVVPTAADIASLADVCAMLEDQYVGLYRCGQPVMNAWLHPTNAPVDDPRQALLYEGCSLTWRTYPRDGGMGNMTDLSQLWIGRPGRITQEQCPPTARAIHGCIHARLTDRRWNKSSACIVIECHKPGLPEIESSLKYRSIRNVPGRDWHEVRSAACTRKYCRSFTAR